MDSSLVDSEEVESRTSVDDTKAQRASIRLKQRLHWFFRPFREWFQLWREYSELSGAGGIARRAFANNSFDGVLTMVGVVMGSFVVGVQDATVVLITGLSTALAIGISGGWGAYLAESAERRHEITELGKSTLTDLNDTKIGKAARSAVITVAAVDGLSPFLSAFLVVIPFFFAPLFPSIDYAFYASLGMALLSLFGLGIYLAGISKENKFVYGIKTAIAGVACMGLTLLMERLSG
ncbi:MAG: VIT1/CCC1 transporter family protein [Anaerolineae bacterium]